MPIPQSPAMPELQRRRRSSAAVPERILTTVQHAHSATLESLQSEICQHAHEVLCIAARLQATLVPMSAVSVELMVVSLVKLPIKFMNLNLL